MTAQESLQPCDCDEPPPGMPPKATLFCQHCGRCGPTDGDWLERPRSYGVAIHCPRCDARLTLRPQYDEDVPEVVHGD